MKKKLPLMPKATAAWLIDNTALTFKQIADFCGIHELEVVAIADGQLDIVGLNPITSGYLTKEEILRCTNNPNTSLQLNPDYKELDELVINHPGKKRKCKYIPLANRSSKINAISWIIKNYPTLEDTQIAKLVGSTKKTVASIRDKTHWNIKNISPKDPVILGLCTQKDLNEMVLKGERMDIN